MDYPRTVRWQAHRSVVHVDQVSPLYAHPCAMGEVQETLSLVARSASRSLHQQEAHQAVQPQ